MPHRLSPLCLLIVLATGACHLVDQRDFDRTAGVPPKPKGPAGPPAHPVPALVTVRYSTPDPPYREALSQAVQKALARKRDVLFTVTTLVPPAAGTDEQASAAASAADSGREIAQAIADDGAEPGQIEQIVRIDPSASVREVLVEVH
jgi:hypothetical protein